MRALTRRFIVILCCCWLPLPALAAMALDCHLLDGAVTSSAPISAPSSASAEHSGCGGKEPVASAAELSDSELPCDHCQTSCHTTSLFMPDSAAELPAIVLYTHPAFAPSLPETVVLDNPQRPPQVI